MVDVPMGNQNGHDVIALSLNVLDQSIRFIAGASGGMVTGGYLAELSARAGRGEPVPGSLTGFIEQDILAYQQQPRPIRPPGMDAPPPRRVPQARDSLSAIAWQLLRDLGHIVRSRAIEADRGRVLQAHWQTLDRPFASLREEEAQGIRPSVIFSPMLIESGAPFFISNLDLQAFRTKFRRHGQSNADDHSAELFRVMPGAHAEDGLTVATAARLSATFPYIVPAVSLPTVPYRRVVDAGYYDNYGIDVVTGILNTEAVRDWVVRNCSGVLVIALRAFADESQEDTPDADPDTEPDGPAPALARLFWWLTSPVEAMFNARGSSQSFRNQEQLRLTRQLYGAALARARAAEGGTDEKWAGDWQQQGRDFVDIVTFACAEESSMSWHLSEADMTRLQDAARAVTARDRPDMQRLLELWNRQHGSKPPLA